MYCRYVLRILKQCYDMHVQFTWMFVCLYSTFLLLPQCCMSVGIKDWKGKKISLVLSSSFSTSADYFTDRAQCKTLLPFTHPQTFYGYFCCHIVWSSGPLHVLQLTASFLQTDGAGPFRELWRCHVTASAWCALSTSGVSHYCLRLSYCVRL
jgi:hypothetical protein